jgi:queuine tRNA-ribosyltransferase
MHFKIEKKLSAKGGSASGGKSFLGRAGILITPHGEIKTPAFVPVGTKASVKALTPEQVRDLGAEVVLANTYHLYLQPGDKLIAKAGGLHKFMNWNGPIITDSGGFQVFSLEVQIKENGARFRSIIDGSEHFLSPEKSIKIQHNLGADIVFAFDECTSPDAPYRYIKEAMERTHRWAERSLMEHQRLITTPKPLLNKEGRNSSPPAKGECPKGEGVSIFGIVQGGRHKDLRKESAKIIGAMDFDGFGIGGSFTKEDMSTAVRWVNEILPEEKPRHLLGIGEPEDFFGGIENGCDLFDCVAPTRQARNGTLYTKNGKINITNAKYKNDFKPIEKGCGCYVCLPRQGGARYSRAYLAHLFHSKEMLAATLASIHNLYFIVNLVKKIRQSILDDSFFEFKEKFLKDYLR